MTDLSIFSKYSEFIILIFAASVGLILNYWGMLSQPNYAIYYIVLLVVALSFFELRKYQKLESYFGDITQIKEQFSDAIKVIKDDRIRIGRIGDRWVWNRDGTLFIGNTRNVTLRTKTLQILLDSFKDSPNYNKKLRDSSKEVGISFSEDLQKELNQKGSYNYDSNIEDRIKLWLEFDSDTGMGKFEVQNLVINGTSIRGKISVENSFVASDKLTVDNQCIFFEGYFEGIFQKFIRANVEIHEVSCKAKGSKCCVFAFTSL